MTLQGPRFDSPLLQYRLYKIKKNKKKTDCDAGSCGLGLLQCASALFRIGVRGGEEPKKNIVINKP